MLPLSPEPAVAKQETEPTKPSLTSGAFLSFGSQTWEAREPGSPCSPPCLDPCCGRLGVEEQPEEKRKRCLLTLHSELAPVIKTTQLPREVHLPATLPHRQFAAIGLVGCDGRKRPTGKNPPTVPQSLPQRESLSSGLRDTKACFLQRSELYKGWVRFSVKGYQ